LSSFSSSLDRALHHANAFLDRLDDIPVSATVTYDELKRRLDRPLIDAGTDPATVIDDLAADIEGGLTVSTSGRFFSWVIGGSLPSALAADWLTSTWDQNAGMFSVAPAAAVVEEIAGAWLKELLGIPTSASFAMVTGCQMAHFTCLAAARNALLGKRGWDAEKQGLAGSPPIRILTNDQYHATFALAVRYAGIGTDALVPVASKPDGSIDPDALRAELANGDGPTIVQLQAGDINTGVYDDFEAAIPTAHEYDAWVHIDGAFGLWCNASPDYRHLLNGVEAADSWATDGHKWLNVPYDSGYAFVAHPEPHAAAMGIRASYLSHADDDARDQMDWTPEWSRRARGFATYAAIRELGRTGIADLVERLNHHAHDLVTRLAGLPNVEMRAEPIINQGLVRFLDPTPGATDHDHDARTDEVITRVTREGEAFFGGVTWRGMRCMRISVSNWLTSGRDVDRAMAAVERCLLAGT
jgi:glutamate/tyrosine decarboxylase-like PLP-dependent enzyme